VEKLLTEDRVGTAGEGKTRTVLWLAPSHQSFEVSCFSETPVEILSGRIEETCWSPCDDQQRCRSSQLQTNRDPGEESRTLTSVRLRSMHQEWMAQVHRACVALGRDDGSMSACREAVSGELPQRQPLFSRRRKLPSDVRV
jgi:hypothetical protein